MGWRASRTAHASFVLDALEQALHDRRPTHRGGLIHHSDRGSQYVSIKYTERLAEAGIEPSVGSVGDSYDNALAETINGLYKAEVIHRRGPWRSFEAVDMPRSNGSTGSTIAGCWNPSATSRLPKPNINIMLPRTTSIWQRDSQLYASGKPGAVQVDLPTAAESEFINQLSEGSPVGSPIEKEASAPHTKRPPYSIVFDNVRWRHVRSSSSNAAGIFGLDSQCGCGKRLP